MNTEKFENNLLAFLFLYEKTPLTLYEAFCKNGVFTDKFKNKIENNKTLSDLFSNMNFDKIPKQISEEKIIVGESIPVTTDESDILKKQLNDALENDDFEKAIEIRDYMKLRGIEFKAE